MSFEHDPDAAMPRLSRRRLLAATAIGVAARAMPAFAAPAPQSFRHGAFEVSVVSDGHLVLPTTFIGAGGPKSERDGGCRASTARG